MNAKALLIPVAAFAVTVTGVSAFNSEVLENAGLSEEQIAAFEVAHELRQEGDKDGARDVLVEAGVDMDTMKTIRRAMHDHRHEMHEAMHEALENDDYKAFKEVIEGSPLADIVTTEADFELFQEAHELKEAGDREAAKEIMEEIGFEEKPHFRGGHRHGHGRFDKAEESE